MGSRLYEEIEESFNWGKAVQFAANKNDDNLLLLLNHVAVSYFGCYVSVFGYHPQLDFS